MTLKAGGKSTEFWALVGVGLLAVGKMVGVVPPETQTPEEAIPALIDAVKHLAGENSQLLIMAGLAWAYIRRRSALKQKELNNNGI